MTRPKDEETRVNGPYQVRKRWRLVIFEDGRQRAVSYATKVEAEQAKLELTGTSGKVVDQAVKEFLEQMARKGCKAGSVRTAGFRLRAFFGDVEAMPVGALTAKKCGEL